TLYVNEQDTAGESSCYDACAESWPPLEAPANAQRIGDWSVIARDDGLSQWALRGKPLYRFAGDENIGDALGLSEENSAWRKADFNPGAYVKLPMGTEVREAYNAAGQVLTNAEGMTLYTFSEETAGAMPLCRGECTSTWQPHLAPEIANPIGDFTVVRRDDGINQWAYKGKPLYTYVGDHEAGDALGEYADARWNVAALVSYFMPAAVVISQSDRHGPMLSTADGYPLYARDANRFTGGGASHADRSIARGSPDIGRQIGLTGCDAECEQTWVPYLAGEGERPGGYWSIIERPDGARQWAFAGYALYTYTADEPGTIRGHDIYDLDGKVPNFRGPPMSAGPQALYWRVALP
ncbi:MAG: hypothetical protein RLN70_04220, partial [Rhodospirillaceae bacterium]